MGGIGGGSGLFTVRNLSRTNLLLHLNCEERYTAANG